jgi:hypothetical protein
MVYPAGQIANTHRSSDDMSDLHVVVIHDIGQVICWITVGLQQNGIVINTIHCLEELLLTILVLPCRPKHEIFEFRVLVCFQPDNMCFSLCRPFFRFFSRYVNALAIVSERKTGLIALSGKGV